MLKASYKKYTLKFKRPGGTSRGVLMEKDSWFLFLEDTTNPDIKGIGECGLLKGLSTDDVPDYEQKLQWLCLHINDGIQNLYEEFRAYPSIQFGLEMAWRDFQAKGSKILHPSAFTSGEEQIPINGLVWMGSKEFMLEQIKEKLQTGFTCVKLKIGAIDFQEELSLLKYIRKEYTADEIELRVDANGAFQPKDALEKLKRLSDYQLHSIEQPIKQKQPQEMARLCEETPLPIALDEELIGILDKQDKQELLNTINPQYIILKPSFIGGYKGSDEWIEAANNIKAGWWITSALESNIGLNAIAQYTATLNNPMPQGLGTGNLYTNNFDSPLYIEYGKLGSSSQKKWNYSALFS